MSTLLRTRLIDTLTSTKTQVQAYRANVVLIGAQRITNRGVLAGKMNTGLLLFTLILIHRPQPAGIELQLLLFGYHYLRQPGITLEPPLDSRQQNRLVVEGFMAIVRGAAFNPRQFNPFE